MKIKFVFVIMVLALLAAPIVVQAGSGPGPIDGDFGGPPPKPIVIPDPEYPPTDVVWWPGDPAREECDRAGGEDLEYAIRIGTGVNEDLYYGLTRTVFGNTISIQDIFLTKKAVEDVVWSWTADPDPISLVIVKTGRESYIFSYDPAKLSDTYDKFAEDFWSPSHLTFCWNAGDEPEPPGPPDPPEPPEPPEPCDWVDETAWGAGDPYVEQGNWGTYTPYVYNPEFETRVVIWAGQNMEAGYLTFSDVVDGNVLITITLFDGWQFQDVEENVKIQPYPTYDDVPIGENPNIGSFEYKETAEQSPFEIEVPYADYYGIHLDVEWAVYDCEE